GPATGGLILSQWLAHHLNVPAVFAEHHSIAADKNHDPSLLGHFILRRNYDKLVKHRRVLVVDDIVNTGHSIKQTIEAVRRNSGEVVG
ncbi:phosphoribosyltransferase family protein, partial [Acinetobacter baumannii]